MAHKHAELMRQYAEDAQKCENPWVLWEVSIDEGNTWRDLTDNPGWYYEANYRRKGKHITIGNYEIPMPETNPPQYGEMYYVSHLLNNYVQHRWNNDTIDNIYLNRGIVHLTAKAATLHTLALLSFTAYKVRLGNDN